MNRKRHVIEGVWSGYTGGQRRVCHRTVTFRPEKFLDLSGVRFTDGTFMSVFVRQCLPRERIKEIHGYDGLLYKIAKAGLTGSVSVTDSRLGG